MNDEIANRLETILKYDIALHIIELYKYNFTEGSYYYDICRQMEKMLIDSCTEQYDVIESMKEGNKDAND